jgi:hypothetical protein
MVLNFRFPQTHELNKFSWSFLNKMHFEKCKNSILIYSKDLASFLRGFFMIMSERIWLEKDGKITFWNGVFIL